MVRKDITEEPEFIEVDSIEGEQVITEDAGQQEFRLKDEQIQGAPLP